MFNKDFYPTPTDVIQRMITTANLDIKGKIILEPSAGTGNIVDYLNSNGAKEVLTCEKEEKLLSILSTKSNILSNDFLTLDSTRVSHIDAIVMNPPFSNGIDHLLHAYQIAPSGCQILSLFNTHTLDRDIRKVNELKQIIRDTGTVTHFGECFKQSERTTNVSISFIHLSKQQDTNEDNEFDGYFDMDDTQADQEDGIVKYNYVRDIVGRYVQAVSLFNETMEANNKINEITKPIATNGVSFGAYRNGSSYNSGTLSREEYKKELQTSCWQNVFRDIGVEKYMTTKAQGQLNKFIETQTKIPFTVKNIYKMAEIIIGTHKSRMEQSIVDTFDTISRYSIDDTNEYTEKWVTNKTHCIGKKFIIPCLCQVGYSGKPETMFSNYGRSMKATIDDMIKCLCYITGEPYDRCGTIRDAIANSTFGSWSNFPPFFNIKTYKKGTVHFQFKDAKVQDKLNKQIAKLMGEKLPTNTK